MATFRVHVDLEKENRTVLSMKTNQANVNGKEKRPTLGVLGHISSNARDNCEKTVVTQKVEKIAFKQVTTENVFAQAKAQAKKIEGEKQSTLAAARKVEPARPFAVYEDGKENDHVGAKSEAHGHHVADKRAPLCELKPELLETPMSVGDVMSPMSVDKSMISDEDKSMVVPRNDRERFFEVEEYQVDILEYLKKAEHNHRPKPHYMTKQPDITPSMRTILVDWLVEVCEEYRLQNETLYLAVSYIDRFLSHMSVVRAKLQLVGTAAMFIAAKYEEIYPPDVSEFVYITDDTYSKIQVLRMEQLILKVLSFDLSVPTSLVFTNSYAVMNDVPDKVKFLSMYFCELSLLETDPYLKFTSSKISAAALALSRYTLDLPIWSKSLETNTGYSLMDLKELVYRLNKSHHAAKTGQQQAIQEKYKNTKYAEVSVVPPATLKEEIFEQRPTVRAAESTEHNESVRQMISSLVLP